MGVLYARVAGAWVPVGGGGSGADEVHVGPDQPADTLELWVDTDETAPLPDDTRWNTAWGIVAVGSMVAGDPLVLPLGVDTQVTSTVRFAMQPGRRYRIVMAIRAARSQAAECYAQLYLRDGTTPIYSVTPLKRVPAYSLATYDTLDWAWTMSGDGVTRNWNVAVIPTGTVDSYPNGEQNQFYIEDLGPVSGAAPALMTTTDRWNTAWGVVAVGTMKPSPINYTTTGTYGKLTEPLAFTSIKGRRYAFHVRVRAALGGTQSGMVIMLVNGSQWTDNHNAITSGGMATLDQLWVGDGVANTYEPVWYSGTTGTLYPDQFTSYFYIEDLGPVSGAVPIADPTPPWTALPLTGGWANFHTDWSPSGYRKLGDDVEVRGIVSKATVSGADDLITTLPVGYRPPKHSMFLCLYNLGGTGTYNSTRVDVRADGRVLFVPGASPNVAFVALDPIKFSVTL